MNAPLSVKAAVGINARKEFEEKNPGKKAPWWLSRKLIGPSLVAISFIVGKLTGLEFDSEKLVNGVMYSIDHWEEIAGAITVLSGAFAAFRSFAETLIASWNKRKKAKENGV